MISTLCSSQKTFTILLETLTAFTIATTHFLLWLCTKCLWFLLHDLHPSLFKQFCMLIIIATIHTFTGFSAQLPQLEALAIELQTMSLPANATSLHLWQNGHTIWSYFRLFLQSQLLDEIFNGLLIIALILPFHDNLKWLILALTHSLLRVAKLNTLLGTWPYAGFLEVVGWPIKQYETTIEWWLWIDWHLLVL